jgi:hypothetical protein
MLRAGVARENDKAECRGRSGDRRIDATVPFERTDLRRKLQNPRSMRDVTLK